MRGLSKYMEDLSTEKRELFELLMKEKKASRVQPISKREDTDTFPLSFAQQRLWFLDQWEPGSPVYNLPQAVHLQGRLDLAALQQTLNEIVRRHETLRVTFGAMDGQPIQTIASTLTVSLPIMDLHELTPAEREAEVQRLIIREARQPFDLARGPLLRATLLQLAKDERIMLLTLHHIVSDGWSNGVLVQEIGVLYRAFSAGHPSPLPELAIQYVDFAHWQRQWLRGEVLEKQLSYWKRQLTGAPPVLELPTDYPRPPIQTYSGARHFVKFSKSLTKALKALGQREGASLFITLLAAFKVLLYRYTNQGDIVVGSPVANRNRAEVEALIGFFVNMLAIRTNLSGNPTFRTFLRQVRKVTLEAQDHQDLPFEKLVDELHLERGTSHVPLFQVICALQNAPLPTLKSPDVTIRPLQIDGGTAQFDLSLDLYEAPDGLQGWFEYNTDLFEAATIARLAGHFQALLEGIIANPEQHTANLPLLTEAECHQLLNQWSGTRMLPTLENACVPALFEAQVVQTPDAVALVFQDQHLTYQELNCRANQLAHHLQTLGVGPEMPVGICLERSIEMVVGTLAILKAGGAYVPLEPTYPKERLAYMLDDTQMTVLLTQQSLLEQLPSPTTHLFCLDTDWTAIAAGTPANQENPTSGVTADNLAYVMYTSGSTGIPKGTNIVHRGIVRLVKGANYATLTAEDVFLQFAPISFDASTLEIWGSLLNGGRLVIFPANTLSLDELGHVVEQCRVTILWLTAGLFHQMVEEHYESLKAVDQLLAGGDVLSVPHVCKVLEERERGWLINGYGPTENTTFTCCYPMTDVRQVGVSVSIGRPITGTQIYLLDNHLQLVPVGVPGELHIGGDGLARGYLNRPDLTAEKFIPSPFSELPGERLYKTGDLARYLPDGNIEFLGRMDHQVKVRGFRIELGEIEAVLAQYPAVQEAVVIAWKQMSGDKQLVAYLVPDETHPPMTSELRRSLQEKLPNYMVPATFVMLEALPLNPNGKVDRRALPAPDAIGSKLESAFVAPRIDTEALLADIWSKVLGIEQIGIYDSFFDLGGHSLLATQIVARIRKTLQTDLPLRTLFDHPNIAGLAVQVRAFREAQQGLQAPSVVPVSRDQKLPLSFAQEQLWVVDQLAPGNVAYSIPATARVKGSLNLAVLQQCFDTLLQRHEIFRTTYTHGPEHPIQIVHPTQTFPLTIIDVRDSPTPEQEAQRMATEATRQPIDLTKSPVVRGFVFQLADEEYGMLMLMPHIVVDEWSTGIILGEMQELYEAFSQGESAALPELPIQYADYAYWQRHWLRDEVLEATLAYWRQQLADVPASLDLPTDRPRPPVQTFRGGDVTAPLPQPLFEDILALGRQSGVTPFMTLLAAFKTLLYRYTNQADIVIGTPIADRGLLEVEELVGYFLNVLPLRTDLSGNPTFLELLERVREVCLAGYAHQNLYFERLVQELQPERDPSRNPLFTVMFVFRRNYPMADVETSGLTVSYLSLPGDVARFDLCMYVLESVKGTRVQIIYNSDLFNESTISQMLDHFKTLLIEVVRDPTQRIADLPLLQEAERHRLLVEWNATRAEYPQDVCIHELFEAQAARTPEAVAAIFEGEQLTYQELEQQANQLAHHLKSLGVQPGKHVAVYMHRSLEMIPALLGILKAGGAYVPLEISFPPLRLQWIANSLNVRCLITQSEHLQTVQGLDLPALQHVICLDPARSSLGLEGASAALTGSMRLWNRPDLERLSQQPLPPQVSPEDMAYVIFTSGSTGTPKGVMVQHRPVINLIEWVNKTYDMGPGDRALFITSLSFDLSVYDIFGLLAAGGSIQIVSDQDLREPEQLLRLLCTRSITFWDSAPAALQQLVPFFASVDTSNEDCRLRLAFLSGDWIPVTLPDRVRDAFPGVQVISLGGATEATVWSNYYPIGEVDPGWTSIPYGKPIQNARYYILDSRLESCPIGVHGDLYIGGECLSLGYANDPELTATKYLPDPFSEAAGTVMYRTGDRARFWPDGNIEFLGRLDFQVKIRGYRIELGEIETVLAQYPAVRENLVVAQDVEGGFKEKRLVAYTIPQSGQDLSVNDLRTFLKEELPEYMVPAAFVTLDAFPLTANGKIDRKALPLPEQVRPELAHEYVATRNVVEEVVAHLWAEVLKLDRVGVHDSFFEVGGHSLSAIQILSRLSDTFQTELPLQDLFEEPTVAAVAASLIDNEAKPGQAENIAQIWKRVEMASQEELEEALEQKEREQTMLVSLP